MNAITEDQAYKMMLILAEIYGRQHNCDVRIVKKADEHERPARSATTGR